MTGRPGGDWERLAEDHRRAVHALIDRLVEWDRRGVGWSVLRDFAERLTASATILRETAGGHLGRSGRIDRLAARWSRMTDTDLEAAWCEDRSNDARDLRYELIGLSAVVGREQPNAPEGGAVWARAALEVRTRAGLPPPDYPEWARDPNGDPLFLPHVETRKSGPVEQPEIDHMLDVLAEAWVALRGEPARWSDVRGEGSSDRLRGHPETFGGLVDDIADLLGLMSRLNSGRRGRRVPRRRRGPA